jgi:hypothetical protein
MNMQLGCGGSSSGPSSSTVERARCGRHDGSERHRIAYIERLAKYTFFDMCVIYKSFIVIIEASRASVCSLLVKVH